MVLNTSNTKRISNKGLLTTLACDAQGKPVYALEGSVFIAGAVIQWLRDQLKVIPSSSAADEAIKGVHDNDGVYFVPAFVGLGAPHWDAQARGIITGLTRGSNVKHIIRAARESIAYQTKEIFDLMQQESGLKIKSLAVDGGACQSNFLMQFQADMLCTKIIRPKMVDSTIAGVAHLAGVSSGLWNVQDLIKMRSIDQLFSPRMKIKEAKKFYEGWQKAVQQVKAHS